MMPHTHDRTLLAQRLRDHAEQEHGIEVQGRPIGVVAADHRRDHINDQTVNGQSETADTLAVALERNDWDPMIAELAATDVLRIIRTDPPPDVLDAIRDAVRNKNTAISPEALGLVATGDYSWCYTHSRVPGWACDQGCDIRVRRSGNYYRLPDEDTT